jgi:isoleucyl-tRNA synthetase
MSKGVPPTCPSPPPPKQGLGDKLPADVASVLSGPDVKAAFAIWTTTPWTIPANLAVAVNADLDYCLVKAEVSKG